MHIILRISLDSEKQKKLVVSEFWESLVKSENIIDLQWPSDRVRKIIDILSNGELNLWHAYMHFEKKELISYDFFEVIPTQVVNISQKDMNLFDKVLSNNSAIGLNKPHKIPSKIIATTIKLNETSIASYGRHTDEIITSNVVIDILRDSHLSGWYEQDIFKRDGTVHTIYKRLNAKKLVEVKSFDISTPRNMSGFGKKTIDKIAEFVSTDSDNLLTNEEIRNALDANLGEIKETEQIRYLGCKTLTPDQLAGLKDFSRLGTSESPDMLTGWVVTQKARDVIMRNKIRGIRFRPIMIKESESHQKYLEQWYDMVAFLAEHNTEYQHVPLKSWL